MNKEFLSKMFKKLLQSKRFAGVLKVLLYIVASGALTVIVKRLASLELNEETILLANGLVNVLIYFGKNELEAMRAENKIMASKKKDIAKKRKV